MSDAPVSPSPTPPLGVMALVFTDLEGSSALSLAHGRAFETQRERHFELLRAPLETLGGYEVETAGDSLFAVFSSPAQAAQWALRARLLIETEPWPVEVGALRVRFGLHVGEPYVSRDAKTGAPTFRGPATNLAARVMGAANGGQILLSQSAAESVGNGFGVRDLGAHRLKGIGCESLFQLDEIGDAREFGPLQTLGARRHNLPLPSSPFLGRETEIESLRALLLERKTRLLSLCAFGGMGKTRLALHLAETLADHFSDGVWWVALEEVRSAEAMIAAIAAALPFETDGQRAPMQQIGEFLNGKNLLLVLDNTEQIEGAPDLIAKLLTGAAQFQILATTRHALGIRAETTREISPFTPTQGAQFFAARAQACGATFDADDPLAAQIAARVEGVPLALELAASLARVLGLPQILERLDDQLNLLRSRLPDLPPRQRALRATMDWSFEMLQPSERELFSALSVFAGGFDLEDVETIFSHPDALFDLDELHRRSLLRATSHSVRVGEKRFSLLESVRTYAAQKRAGGDDEIEKRHAAHFARKFSGWRAQLRTSGETRALCEAELDFDNARAALRFFASHCQTRAAAELALSFGQILARSGRLREAGIRLQNGLENLGEGETALRAALLLERGGAHFDQFDWDEARFCALEAKSLFERESNGAGRAQSLNLLGLIALKGERDTAGAREFFEQAGQGASGSFAGIVASNRGLVELRDNDPEKARGHFETARRIYEAAGFERGLAEARTNLGVLAQEAGQLEEAGKFYRAALELELKMRGQIGVARALTNLGELEFLENRPQNAAPILAAGVLLFERAGSPHQSYAHEWLQKACEASGENGAQLLARFSQAPLETLGEIGLGAR